MGWSASPCNCFTPEERVTSTYWPEAIWTPELISRLWKIDTPLAFSWNRTTTRRTFNLSTNRGMDNVTNTGYSSRETYPYSTPRTHKQVSLLRSMAEHYAVHHWAVRSEEERINQKIFTICCTIFHKIYTNFEKGPISIVSSSFLIYFLQLNNYEKKKRNSTPVVKLLVQRGETKRWPKKVRTKSTQPMGRVKLLSYHVHT
jgi:hypothetical protein